MNDASAPGGAPRRRPSTRRPRPTGRRGISAGLLALLAITLVLGVGWIVWRGGGEEAGPQDVTTFAPTEQDLPARSGDRAVMLVFPEWDAGGYVTEQRQIPSRDRPGEDLLGLMTVLCAGPRISGAVSALPAGTRALGAFIDPDDQSVVLDFSQELVTGHPGGSAAEAATLTSILRTVALNFPGTRACTILVEGAQVETLAGHLDLARPFDPRRWL
ncbi:MAG TPA: GerMN domain-containing protein [Candidatus Krumholzibacteria bacterium]|nr:GerMN domain-containing protein [Candidatus Krumholzibacteria bacterium]